jgi:hypothetical protein
MAYGAYNDLTPVRAGMLDGLEHNIESRVADEATQFGDPVFYKNGDEDKEYLPFQNSVTQLLSADLVASNVLTTTVTLNGVALTPVATTYASSHAASMTTHIAAVAALTGVTCVAGSTNRAIVITGDAATDNVSVVSVVTLGASQATVADTYATSFKFGGVAVISQRSFVDSTGEYPATDMVNVLTEGEIWVSVPDGTTGTANQIAYVIANSDNANYKKFTATATNNYDSGCYFKSNPIAVGTGKTFAKVEVRGIK